MCQVWDSNQVPVPTCLEELSKNLPPIQHRELSRIFFSIQECNCGIRRIQGKMRSTVWTVILRAQVKIYWYCQGLNLHTRWLWRGCSTNEMRHCDSYILYVLGLFKKRPDFYVFVDFVQNFWRNFCIDNFWNILTAQFGVNIVLGKHCSSGFFFISLSVCSTCGLTCHPLKKILGLALSHFLCFLFSWSERSTAFATALVICSL